MFQGEIWGSFRDISGSVSSQWGWEQSAAKYWCPTINHSSNHGMLVNLDPKSGGHRWTRINPSNNQAAWRLPRFALHLVFWIYRAPWSKGNLCGFTTSRNAGHSEYTVTSGIKVTMQLEPTDRASKQLLSW